MAIELTYGDKIRVATFSLNNANTRYRNLRILRNRVSHCVECDTLSQAVWPEAQRSTGIKTFRYLIIFKVNLRSVLSVK